MKEYRTLGSQEFREGDFLIRTIQPEDIEDIRIWRNAQVRILRQSKEITRAEQENYFNTHIWPTMGEEKPAQLLFGYKEKNELIGYGGLVHISWQDYRAEVSFLLNPKFCESRDMYGRLFLGYLDLIKKAAFKDLGLNRIFTETFDIRDFHISILEKAGFRKEGVLKEHVFIDGKFVDSLTHGYLRSYGY